MSGPCMCGDTQCWSCGPAQGNWRCPICNAWADDACEHMDDGGSDLKPEFHAEAERIGAKQAAADNAFAAELLADQKIVDDWVATRGPNWRSE